MCQATFDICIDRGCRKEPQLRLLSIWAVMVKSVSAWIAIAFCSSIGGVGTMSDLTLSDFRFFIVDPTASEFNALYIMDELNI